MVLKLIGIVLAILYAAVSIVLFQGMEKTYSGEEEFQEFYRTKSWLKKRCIDAILILMCIFWPVVIVGRVVRKANER